METVQISWTDNTGDELGFKVFRFNGVSFVEVGDVAPNTTTFIDSGLDPGSLYFYWVWAYSGGYIKTSPVVLTALTEGDYVTAPTFGSAFGVSTTEIELQWNDRSSNETGFKIFRFNGASWAEVSDVGAGVTTFTDSSLSAGTSYYYWVWAYNASGLAFAPNILYATTYSP